MVNQTRENIPYGTQYISEEDIKAVVETLKSPYLTQGPKIAEFENAFAAYIGVEYAVAVSNGTAALHLCAMAMDVKPGQKVITTPITFVASANCVKYCGGEIVFADIDPETFLLDIHEVEKLLEASPKGTYAGIIPVDFAGKAVDLQAFRKLADEYGLWLIEDSCHAPGGFFNDDRGQQQNCGNGVFADLAIFSLHPVKHIASGEGGIITTNNEVLYNKLLKLRSHGIIKNADSFENTIQQANGDPSAPADAYPFWYMEMQELGYNYRLTDIQAALGLSQLQRADAGLKKRRSIAKEYDEAFVSVSGIKSQLNELNEANSGHAYHLYILQVENRLGLYNYLHTKQIIAQIHYIPSHLMPYYKKLGWKEGDFPDAEAYYGKCISIPMYPTLTEEQQLYVIDTIKSFYKN
jgi:UDP-4-amino-4,6-dideoxy-N-acetyl-beta-L-altrosamine transaminase